jgi:hypothetical protein
LFDWTPAGTTAVTHDIDRCGNGENDRVMCGQLRLGKTEVSLLETLILHLNFISCSYTTLTLYFLKILLSLASTTEELLERKSSGPGLEIEITVVGDPPY